MTVWPHIVGYDFWGHIFSTTLSSLDFVLSVFEIFPNLEEPSFAKQYKYIL